MLNGSGAIASNPASSSTGSAVTVDDGNPHQVVIVYNGPNDSPANYLYVYLDPAFNPGTHTPVAGSIPLFWDRSTSLNTSTSPARAILLSSDSRRQRGLVTSSTR